MSTVAFASPRMAVLDNSKGNFQNRLECSSEHFANSFKTMTGVAAGTGVGAFIGHSVYKSGLKELAKTDYLKAFKDAKGFAKFGAGVKHLYSTAQDKLVNLLKNPEVQKKIGKSDTWINKTTKHTLCKFSSKFKTRGAKTGFVIAVGAAAISLVCGVISHFFKKGQIDQKYTDKARQEKETIEAKKLRFNNDFELNKIANEYDAFMEAVVNARKY